MKTIILPFAVLTLIFINQIFAQSLACSIAESHSVGYTLNKKDLALLQANTWLSTTKREPRTQILEKINAYMSIINPKASAHIPQLILLTAKTTQIDPYFLTALIKKESTFDPTRISSGQAYGLTQLTGSGLDEIRNQLGIHNPHGKFKKFKPLQTDFFHSQVLSFFSMIRQWQIKNGQKRGHTFSSAQKQKENYLKWLQSTEGTSIDIIRKRKALQTRDDYALITGALLLKIKLAKTKNQYRPALINYNGDKKHRQEYSRIVISDQEVIRNQPVSCEYADQDTLDVLQETCDITQDKDFCEQNLGWQST